MGKKKLRTNVYEATSPDFPSTIIVNFARFPWEIAQLNAETAAYGWIDGHHIGPAFLGHLTEEGRVIGFLIERVAEGRHAMPADLAACQKVLAKLHSLGIKHGDINRHNSLLCGGNAVLIDFDAAQKSHDHGMLDDELQRVEQELCDSSGKGG